jgi:hypothetical protein
MSFMTIQIEGAVIDEPGSGLSSTKYARREET